MRRFDGRGARAGCQGFEAACGAPLGCLDQDLGRAGARRPWEAWTQSPASVGPLGGPSMGRGAMLRIVGFRQESSAAASASTGARRQMQKQCGREHPCALASVGPLEAAGEHWIGSGGAR